MAHADQHVPYYRRLFGHMGLHGAKPDELAAAFSELPFLDKAAVRRELASLLSDDVHARMCRENWTGGTTGDPVAFLQEQREVRVTGGAVWRWFCSWHGIRPGDNEVKLWGSDRDLSAGKWSMRWRLRRALTGVKLLGTLRKMSPETMRGLIDTLNRRRPVLVRGYCFSLFEVARFALDNGLSIAPPRVVISSAGTLYPVMRQKIESAFGCRVYNHYGTREMHNIAIECPERTGLHVSALTHLVEVLDEKGKQCPPGVEGEIVVTSLLNYAMPLIRYRIGDRGKIAASTCPCGRGLPRLANVGGRAVDAFRSRDGGVIPGEFFLYLFGILLRDGPLTRVQVVQRDYEFVEVRCVLQPGLELAADFRKEVQDKTRTVMGEDCRVEFVIQNDIPASASGKYRCTICQIPENPTSRDETTAA